MKARRKRFSVEGRITIEVEAADVLAFNEKDAIERVVVALLEATPGGKAGRDSRTDFTLDVDGPLDGPSVDLDAFEADAWGDES